MRISTTTGEIAKLTSDADALRMLAKAGFDACDFSMWNYLWDGETIWNAPHDAFDAYFVKLRGVAQEAGILIGQTHAPFPATVGEAGQDERRLSIFRRAIRATALLGCSTVIIHPALHQDIRQDHDKAMAYNLQMYRSLAPTLEVEGVKAAIENMFAGDPETGKIIPTFFSTAEEMAAAMAELGNEHFCVCLDIGHSVLVEQSPAHMIEVLSPWLDTLHVHDNNRLSDQHLIPYLGHIDWDEVCRALRDNGYRGNMNLETGGFMQSIPESMMAEGLRLTAEIARVLAHRVEAD